MDSWGTHAVDDALIAVDAQDRPLHPVGKAAAHRGAGVLHRAFSLFLFDADGRTLLQQRSALKPLWPGYWANSCCSHPRWNEPLSDAVERRTVQELGTALLEPPVRHFQFVYQAAYADVGSEHELCHVLSGRIDPDLLAPYPDEVAAWRWVDASALDAEVADRASRISPWLRLEWPRLRALR